MLDSVGDGSANHFLASIGEANEDWDLEVCRVIVTLLDLLQGCITVH
jgi:hypothetical protein